VDIPANLNLSIGQLKSRIGLIKMFIRSRRQRPRKNHTSDIHNTVILKGNVSMANKSNTGLNNDALAYMLETAAIVTSPEHNSYPPRPIPKNPLQHFHQFTTNGLPCFPEKSHSITPSIPWL
jgi:hypothetical protein